MCGIVPGNEKNMDSFWYVKCILYVVLSLLSIKGSCQAAAGPVVAEEYTPPFPPNLKRKGCRSARTHSNLVSRVQGCCPPRIACPFCSTVTPGSTELEQWTGPKTKWLHQDLPAWWNNHSDTTPESLALANKPRAWNIQSTQPIKPSLSSLGHVLTDWYYNSSGACNSHGLCVDGVLLVFEERLWEVHCRATWACGFHTDRTGIGRRHSGIIWRWQKSFCKCGRELPNLLKWVLEYQTK